MRATATRLAGKPLGGGIGRPRWAAEILKQINAAKRKARPPRPGAAEAAPVEYLFEPWSWYDDNSETHKGINAIPIVKKTAKRIYYDRTDSWDRVGGTVTLGYISREDFETDTRCKDTCPRDTPAGLVCGPHGRTFGHCVHFGVSWKDQDPRCRPRRLRRTVLGGHPGQGMRSARLHVGALPARPRTGRLLPRLACRRRRPSRSQSLLRRHRLRHPRGR
jgi:hypothetical protein